jgi:hypothetical protein
MYEFIFWILVICIGAPLLISRINEELNRAKTLRRMNDVGNMYWDYNHDCWVMKYIPQPTPAEVITQDITEIITEDKHD